ncbi:MAG: superoxide dismutase [Planctomycetota bacterium]
MTHEQLPSNTDAPTGENALSRRGALTALGGLGVFALGAEAQPARRRRNPRQRSEPVIGEKELGWDRAKGEYVVPDLGYDYDALEPYIDAKTMEIHHGNHHAGYVRGLNNALRRLQDIREGAGDVALVKHWSRELAFHGSGHVNHALFWATMAPEGDGGGGFPEGVLAERIDRDFGSFALFTAHFKAAARSVEGSGWAWLVYEPVARRLMVNQIEKQQNTDMTGVIPLLGLDVWEHAYYLKYQNRRSEYVDAFMNIVSWPAVAARYADASGDS